MHLSYSTAKYKGQTYKSYAIAESYREGKKVMKRILWSIGKLTDQQAEQISLICKIAKGKGPFVTQLQDVVVKESKSYLDVAVVNDLWNQWGMDHAFNHYVTNSQLPTHTVAKILTINRCVDPCSHYAIPLWAKKNALEDVCKIDLAGLNDDKIYYELDKIYKNKVSIENYLFDKTHKQNPESYEFINYDLTTSYFVGYKCDLSAFGKGKIECHGRRQVLLGVLINDEGYPFKWDVFPGNAAEVKTLKQNINACKTRFKLGEKNVTLVFDRGIISDENIGFIEEAAMKYVSALDRNQIPFSGIDLEPFKPLLKENAALAPQGFKKYDNELYFHDSGAIGQKRFIVGFNPALFTEDRNNRDEKIKFFKNYLQTENKNLKKARKNRQLDATNNRITNELKRLKIQKYFDKPMLKPLTVQRKLKNGMVRSIKSFEVKLGMQEDVLEADKLLDGVCVFVTNHKEQQEGGSFKVKPQSIIKAYRAYA